MNVVFCNITYMKNYAGITDDDLVISGGGAWVKANQDAGEKFNFLDYNGSCYGYVQVKGDQIHIERLQGISSSDQVANDVMVIWCARAKDGEPNVVVGWYRHANFFRRYYEYEALPGVGEDLVYCVEAKASNCYLLPEKERQFTVPRAQQNGKDRGMGQSNLWYAESTWAKAEFIPAVLKYINEYQGDFINTAYDDAILSESAETSEPYKIYHERAMEYLEQERYLEALQLFNRAKVTNNTSTNLYHIGIALRGLYQFDRAIEVFEQVVSIEGNTWDALSPLPYLYEIVRNYKAALMIAEKLLQTEESQDNAVKCELYGIIADSYISLGNTNKARQFLEKIISESNVPEIIEHSKSMILELEQV